jgi:hypothetical protein
MSSRFWRWYADRQFHKWEKTVLWDMVEPYRPPRSFAPLVGTYVAAFYTGVVGAAVTEQLYKVSQPQRLGSPSPYPFAFAPLPPATGTAAPIRCSVECLPEKLRQPPRISGQFEWRGDSHIGTLCDS